eukprot:12111595-Alexandrium_andersonii.AAC.1
MPTQLNRLKIAHSAPEPEPSAGRVDAESESEAEDAEDKGDCHLRGCSQPRESLKADLEGARRDLP